jgi:hypothetical protein
MAHVMLHFVFSFLFSFLALYYWTIFIYYSNNNQVFFSQASWGKLEMKPHEQKKQVQNKSEKEGEKQVTIKKPNQKRRKNNKTLRQKSKKWARKKLDKRQ